MKKYFWVFLLTACALLSESKAFGNDSAALYLKAVDCGNNKRPIAASDFWIEDRLGKRIAKVVTQADGETDKIEIAKPGLVTVFYRAVGYESESDRPFRVLHLEKGEEVSLSICFWKLRP